MRRVLLPLLAVSTGVITADMLGQDYRRIDLPANTRTIGTGERLSRIGGIAAAPGAGVSISQPETGVVLHYDGTGKLQRRFGGDSLFKRLDRHGWHGPFLWTHDLSGNRMTLFHGTTGSVSTTFDLQRFIGIARPVAMTPDGLPIVEGYFRNPGAGAQEYRNSIAVIGTFGPASPRTLVELSHMPCASKLGSRWVNRPWCQLPMGAVAPSGEWLAAVSPGTGGDTTRTTVRLTFIGARGDTLRAVNVDTPTLAVAEGRRRSELEALVHSHGLNASHDAEFRASVSAEPSYPVAAAAFATNDRTVWLAQQTGSGWRYIVLSTDGRVVGRYATAANLQLMAAAGRSAFGVRTLANGREQVVRVGF